MGGKHKKIAGIYSITNIENSKKYIGHSVNIYNRWDGHKHALRRDLHKNKHLQSAWNEYGENMFAFSILETLPLDLTKQEYEEIETKWVLKFNSHESEFGYNAVLPGSVPLKGELENKTSRNRKVINFVCINISTKERVTLDGKVNVSLYTGVPSKKVNDLANYWRGKGRKRSLHNWSIVRESDFDDTFDYISSPKKPRKLKENKTIRVYRKNPEDIIPREQRNLKRVGVIAVNVVSKEERVFRMVKDTYEEFLRAKVNKCLNAPFGKYQHRGYYFKRAEEQG